MHSVQTTVEPLVRTRVLRWLIVPFLFYAWAFFKICLHYGVSLIVTVIIYLDTMEAIIVLILNDLSIRPKNMYNISLHDRPVFCLLHLLLG